MALAVYEMFERMTYCGISANLVLYLTKNLNQGTVAASNTVTYWGAAIWLTPIFGAYVADAHLGRYTTFLIASAFYFMVCTPFIIIYFQTMLHPQFFKFYVIFFS